MIEIRTASPASLSGPVLSSLTRMLDGLVRDGAALGWTAPPTRDEIEALLRGIADAPPGDACAVLALEGQEVLGAGWWQRHATPTQRQNADLDKLAVAPHASGRGLGRRILRRLLAEADGAGIEHLTLDLREGNEIAQRLYASEGFREYGRLPGFVAPGDGTRCGKIFLVRALG
ncbi:GNAT family N-acetyltransferase [Kocuria palustris]|uniref:GNAT family N-acetyltransferase n=1 Tax=Kocuria palustris TaxID=71999 RepID=UPI00119CD95B|nr:GNAT family N-acetyltransferase [Kocuria palustris]